jgi:hypothetical protein
LGDGKKGELRDTLKLPAASCCICPVIPAELFLAKAGSENLGNGLKAGCVYLGVKGRHGGAPGWLQLLHKLVVV